MKSKKILSFLLVLCMLLGCIAPAGAVTVGSDSVGAALQQGNATSDTQAGQVVGGTDTLPTLRNDPSLATPAGSSQEQSGSNAVSGKEGWVVTPSEGYEVEGAKLPTHIRELREAAAVYAATDVVEAFVLLEEDPLISNFSSPTDVSDSVNAYVQGVQESVIESIEHSVLGGKTADIGTRLTFLTNGFSINVEFGKLEEIANLPGVKSVFLVPYYQVCEADSVVPVYRPFTESSGEMSDVPTVWEESGYTGKGMTIAILDTGLDIDHPSFSEESFSGSESAVWDAEMLEAVLPSLEASKIYEGLTAEDLYHSSKVPFAFNYGAGNLYIGHDDGSGDHGTHVAGIAAANKLDTTDVVGMAPDAQVFVMKVFAGSGGASGTAIIAALTDCLALGVDVVNLSLGSPAGFSESGNELMDSIYAAIASTEVVVNIAAGNEGVSSYYNMWNTHTNPTTNPDNATVASPSTYANVNSIASVDNSVTVGSAIILDGQPHMYNDGKSLYVTMADVFGGKDLEFVIVPDATGTLPVGLGTAADFEGADVEGKVAVVLRGEISFVEKLANAEASGAIALVVINNAEGSVANFGMAFYGDDGETPDPSITGETPAILVSLSTGEAFLEAAAAGVNTFTVSPTAMRVPDEGGGQLSVFSGWGPSPDFRIVPDLAGVGGNVYSTIDNGKYGYMSGTSMACPQVTGVSALIMQYLKDIGMHDSDVLDYLMMSTAEVSVSHESGVEFSPRQQGAGLANALNAVTSGAYVTVAGETNDNKPKAELGDSATGTYSFTMTVHNFSTVTKTYTLDSSLLTEDVDMTYAMLGIYFMAGYDCELGGTVDFSTNTVTVAAGETADVTVTITVDAEGKEFLETYYPNGGYVEGYVYLNSEDEGGVDLSVPFMGFYGDWTEAPVFDTAYWYDNSFWGLNSATGLPEGNEYYHVAWMEFNGSDWLLGFNPYVGETIDKTTGKIAYDSYNNVVSPNGDGHMDGFVDLYLSMMRGAKQLWFTMTDAETGVEYYSEYCINVTKTMFNSNYGQIVPFISSWYWEEGFPAFVDHNNGGAALPSGTKVILTITAVQDYEGEYKEQTMVIPVYIDTEAPVLHDNVTSYEEDGKTYITLEFEDEHPAYVQVSNPSGTRVIGSAYTFSEDANGIYSISMDVTGAGTKLSVALCDYGANESFYNVTFEAEGGNVPELSTDALYAYRVYDSVIAGDSSKVYDSLYGWVSVNKETGAVTQITDERYEYYSLTAAEYVDGYIFAIDAGRNFVVIEPGTFYRTTVCNTGLSAYDMTWDATTNTMYVSGKMTDEYGYDYYGLYTIDLLTGELTSVGYAQDYQSYVPYAMAATPTGEIYAIAYYDNYLYTVDKETGEMTYVLDAEGNNLKLLNAAGSVATPYYNQSMTYSVEDGCIYWAYFTYTKNASELFKIIPATETKAASFSSVKPANSVELVGMITVDEDEDFSIPEATELTSVILSSDSMVLLEGKSSTLTVSTLPWNYTVSGEVTWTTDDDSVATVVNGVVTGLKRGTTTITATCEGVEAECEVTVLNANGTAYGFNYYTAYTTGAEEGDYWFQLDTSSLTLTPYFSTPVTFISADYNGHDGYIYGMDESKVFYCYDPGSGDWAQLGVSDVLFYDMAYDYSTGLMYGIDPYTGLYTIDMTNGKTMQVGGPIYNYDFNPVYGFTLACSTDGTLYTICAANGAMYTLAEDPDYPGYLFATTVFTGLPQMNLIQSMWYDHDSGNIFLANADKSVFYIFDLELGAYTTLGTPEDVSLFEYIGMFSLPSVIPELPEIPVESVTAEDLATFVGSCKKIITNVLPMNATNKTMVWTSGDETIATVDVNGVVTGVTPGTTTITGYSADNNELTVTITVTILTPADNLTTYVATDLATYGGMCWGTIDVTNPSGNTQPLADCPYFILSADYVGTTDRIYAYGYNQDDYSENHQFLTLNADTYGVISAVDMGVGFPFVYDMAFDYTTGTMYALASPNETNMNLYMVDMTSGKLILVQTLDFMAQSLVIDENGTIYAISDGSYFYDPMWGVEEVDYSEVYELDPAEGTAEVLFELNTYSNMFASAAYDFDTGYAYWGRFASPDGQTYDATLVVIDLANETCYDLGTINAAGAQVTGMMFQCEEYPDAPTSLMGLTMSSKQEILSVGDTLSLSVMVRPFGYEVDGVWTSSDEEVVTVDENGVVTALSSGSSNVTYTVTEGGQTYSATCKIIIFSEDQYLLSYNRTEGGFAKIDRFSPDTVAQFYTDGEETAVQVFEMVDGIIYGFDEEGNYFSITYANGFDRTYLGEHGVESWEAAGFECDFVLRDMAWDSVNERMLVLGCHTMTDEYGNNYEATNGCIIYTMDLATGALTELITFTSGGEASSNIQAMTVTASGDVYFYSTYVDYFGVIDVETGDITLETTLQSMSIYGDAMALMAMAYDELTDSIFLLMTTNSRSYRLISYDLTTDMATSLGDVGELWREGYYNYGNQFAGLVSVQDHLHVWVDLVDNGDGTHSYVCECGPVVTVEHEFHNWTDNGDGTHTGTCACGYIETVEHELTYTINGGGTHTSTCICGAEEIAEHVLTDCVDNGNGTHTGICVCGATVTELHTLDSSIGLIICPDCGCLTIVIPDLPQQPDTPVPSDPVTPENPEDDKDDVIHVELPNGVEVDTTVNENGEVISTEVEIPADVVTEAVESGKPVELPITTVTNTKDSEKAVEITVSTNSETAVTVEIPVANVTVGTVVVIVDADGVETVVPTCTITENGVVADLPDGATVKVVDKSVDFSDVQDDMWYTDAVDFVSARGILKGTGEDTFSLTATTTRAMFWTMLARLAGADVDHGDGLWYEDAQKWAMENAISDGTNPNSVLTREQLVTMLWRYMGQPTASDSAAEDFSDVGQTSDWAQTAINWAVENDVMNGSNNNLTPKDSTTRAQFAQFIMNFINNAL